VGRQFGITATVRIFPNSLARFPPGFTPVGAHIHLAVEAGGDHVWSRRMGGKPVEESGLRIKMCTYIGTSCPIKELHVLLYFSFDFSGLFDTLAPFYFPVTLWFLLLLPPISMLPLLLPRGEIHYVLGQQCLAFVGRGGDRGA
jgi:hypothetical protein